MSVLFQVIISIFYFFTFLIGVFLLRGDIIFGVQVFEALKEILMPGYLIFCGLMIGYLIALARQGRNFDAGHVNIKENILKKSFIIGIILGLILAIVYVLF